MKDMRKNNETCAQAPEVQTPRGQKNIDIMRSSEEFKLRVVRKENEAGERRGDKIGLMVKNQLSHYVAHLSSYHCMG